MAISSDLERRLLILRGLVPWGQQKQGFYRAQKFIPSTLHKMRRLAEIRGQRGLNFRIEVDGGLAGDKVTHVFMFRCAAAMQIPTG